MKKTVRKIIFGIGITIVTVPFLLIALVVVIEIVGMIANHAATDKQTKELTSFIEKSIEDARISDVYSFTGNTTGTSNHVESESRVTFDSDLPGDKIEHIFSEQYGYHILEKDEESYVITIYGEVPFPDNIEGH